MLNISVFKDQDNTEMLNLIPGEYECNFSIKHDNREIFFTEDGEVEFGYKVYYISVNIRGKNMPPDILSWKHDRRLVVELDFPVYEAIKIDSDSYDNIEYDTKEILQSPQYDDKNDSCEQKPYNGNYYRFKDMYTSYFKFVADSDYKWEWQLIQEIKEENKKKKIRTK